MPSRSLRPAGGEGQDEGPSVEPPPNRVRHGLHRWHGWTDNDPGMEPQRHGDTEREGVECRVAPFAPLGGEGQDEGPSVEPPPHPCYPWLQTLPGTTQKTNSPRIAPMDG